MTEVISLLLIVRQSNSKWYTQVIFLEISLNHDGLAIIVLTCRIHNKSITSNRCFRWCNYDRRNLDIFNVLTRLRPAGTVCPKKDLQFIEEFEQHLRVTILDIPCVIRALCDRQDVNSQVTAQSICQSFQHQMLRFAHRQLLHTLETYVKIVHEMRYVLIILRINDFHLAERKFQSLWDSFDILSYSSVTIS